MNPVHTVLFYFLKLHFNIISTIYIEVSHLASSFQVIPDSFYLVHPLALLWNVKIFHSLSQLTLRHRSRLFYTSTMMVSLFANHLVQIYVYVCIYIYWNYIKRRIQEGGESKKLKKCISVLMWLSQTLHARTHLRSKSARRKKKIRKPGCKITGLGCCWCGWGWGLRVEGEIRKADVSFWRQ